jgi:abnormal spindle-like microcephaly-associated protein
MVGDNEDTAVSGFWKDSQNAFEETAAVEFTTEIRAPLLTQTKPRRGRKTATFKVHEDTKESKEVATEGVSGPRSARTTAVDGKSTILAQPAQRFQRPRDSSAVNSSYKAVQSRAALSLKTVEVNVLLDTRNSEPKQGKGNMNQETKINELKKDVRRQTIYIPPDDTTMPSVFMGLFSPLKSQNLSDAYPSIQESTQINSLEAQVAKRRRMYSSVAAPPRRTPLQQTTKHAQESSVMQDMVGKNGGKENIPPGSTYSGCRDKTCVEELPVFRAPPKSTQGRGNSTMLNRSQPKKRHSHIASSAAEAVSQNPLEALLKHENVSPPSQSTKRVIPKKKAATKKSLAVFSKNPTSPVLSGHFPREKALSKLSISNTGQGCTSQKYPSLTEDISNPFMYEDNWLTHQEIVITQLVNGLFDLRGGQLVENDPETLRHGLLRIYQDNRFTLLYKRLQASILYGALGIPKDMLARGRRLKDDLGFRRNFLDFWLETYDLSSLRVAAETVIGRRIHVPLRTSRDSEVSPNREQGKALKRTLERFLDTLLLRNEDIEPGLVKETACEANRSCVMYRRTVLRSILMIVLLDNGRTCMDSLLPSCLFIPSSRYKSSAAVLQALGTLLLPSVGDITRHLNHLDCQVSYIQHPLQECDYRIKNLAVDIRDGVLLTRLVELILYLPSSSPVFPHPGERSTSVTLPTGKVLSILAGGDDWPLSKHLKLPCVGRVIKMFNVQIALNALLGIKGVGIIAQGVRAEDIVDGYREKTIALLWGLVGKWGLAGLLDWDDVRKEILRLKRKAASLVGERSDGDEESSENDGDFNEGYESHASVLTRWASLLAQLKGLHLDNLTTSFADGKIFESIIEEYEGYILEKGGNTSTVSQEGSAPGDSKRRTASLKSRLQALGCSSQFGKSELTVGCSLYNPS